MLNRRPKVSVLIPTYNYARYLPEAIESVLKQDFTDFELLISDDCSIDNTARIIQHYALHDPRVRIQTHRPNLGMVANWNWCLQHAAGEYIKFIFGDDCFASRHSLSRMVAMLDSTPSAALAVAARFTIDDTSQITGIWDEMRTPGLHLGTTTIARCLAENGNLVGEPSVLLFRREQGLRGFNPKLRQIVDLEMWFHLLLQGEMIYTHAPLCCFRRHGHQQTVANRESQAGDLEMVAILREYLPVLAAKIPPLGTFARKQIIFRTLVHLLKKDARSSALTNEADWLRSQLSPAWRILCWIAYRVLRPVENVDRSARKRRVRNKLERDYPEQLSFLRELRGTSAMVS